MNFERLEKSHNRKGFNSGEPTVDDWLKTKARQAQDKRLSVTHVLTIENEIKGYHTIAIGHINLDELPKDKFKNLPGEVVPIATLAWLGLDLSLQGKGLGEKLLLHAMAHCYKTGLEFPYVAMVLDCLNLKAKNFYMRYGFEEIVGHPMKLFISWKTLEAIAIE